MNAAMAKKEYALFKCERLSLPDTCHPALTHYLGMEAEDDSAVDCARCWDRYLWGIASGALELPNEGRRAVV